MLYSPRVEQWVVLVGAFLFDDVAAKVWLEITASLDESHKSKDEADILEQLSIWSEALVSGLPNKSGEPGPITVPKAVLSTIDEIGSQLTQAREFVAKYTLNKDTDAASSKPSGPRRLQAKRRTTKPVRSSS
jgi:hypothetical protein